MDKLIRYATISYDLGSGAFGTILRPRAPLLTAPRLKRRLATRRRIKRHGFAAVDRILS